MNNQHCLDELYKELYEKIYAYLYVKLSREQQIELQEDIPECIQDAFITLWKKREALKRHPNIRARLYRTSSYNLCNKISVFRTRQKHIPFSIDQRKEDDMESYADAIDFLSAHNDQDSLDAVVEKIKETVDEETYQMLIDYYDKDMPVEQVAREYGVSVSVLKKRVSRIIKKFRLININV